MYRLLIVEDESLCREALVTIAKNMAVFSAVESARNGQEAVVLAARLKPHIVLMDIEMPVLDGLSSTELIKKALPECRIIILTAYDKFSYAVDSIRLGVVNYLLKPFKNEDIVAALMREIRNISADPVEEPVAVPSSENTLRESFEVYIKKNYDNASLSSESMADSIGFSPSYFSKIFKIYMGCSFGEYLRNYRISIAKDLLVKSELNIREIGCHVGYPDANYFIRLFKKHEQCTPLIYRQMHTKADDGAE